MLLTTFFVPFALVATLASAFPHALPSPGEPDMMLDERAGNWKLSSFSYGRRATIVANATVAARAVGTPRTSPIPNPKQAAKVAALESASLESAAAAKSSSKAAAFASAWHAAASSRAAASSAAAQLTASPTSSSSSSSITPSSSTTVDSAALAAAKSSSKAASFASAWHAAASSRSAASAAAQAQVTPTSSPSPSASASVSPSTSQAPSPTTTSKVVSTTSSTTTSKTTTKTTTTTAASATATFTGQATYFFQNGNAGACWVYNDDSTPLVALDYRLYGDMGKQSKDCGRSLTITNTANGKSVIAIVQDACPTCASKWSLDLSTGAFDAIGDRDTGILPITWHWN